MNDFVIFNNRLVKKNEAVIPAGCRALSLGESCFETIRVYSGGYVLGFEDHIERLMRGAVMLGYDARVHAETFRAADCASLLLKLLESRNLQGSDARIRIQIGRLDDSGIKENASPEFFFMMTASEASNAGEPVKLGFSARERISAAASDASVKWSYYAPNVMELSKGRSEGFDDVLLVDSDGNISCAATANVFFIKDDEIITPWLQSGALHGITRKLVIRALSENGIHANEKPISRAESETCDAAFITSSVREVATVDQLGDMKKNADHPMIKKVMELFAEHKSHHRKNLADL